MLEHDFMDFWDGQDLQCTIIILQYYKTMGRRFCLTLFGKFLKYFCFRGLDRIYRIYKIFRINGIGELVWLKQRRLL